MPRFRWLTGRKDAKDLTATPESEFAPMPRTIRQSDDADTIARKLLATIQEQGKSRPATTELLYEIPENMRLVPPMSLILSLMTLADDYGLRFTSLAFGVVYCTKV